MIEYNAGIDVIECSFQSNNKQQKYSYFILLKKMKSLCFVILLDEMKYTRNLLLARCLTTFQYYFILIFLIRVFKILIKQDKQFIFVLQYIFFLYIFDQKLNMATISPLARMRN